MQYIIHAYDHTDSDALARRMAARPAHFAYVSELKAKGQFVLGGALLDPDGKMIGSMLLLTMETEDQLNEYLKNDPYIVQGVWNTIDVKPFRQASV
ncbi:YciI family protein [Spirosoma migulaei]